MIRLGVNIDHVATVRQARRAAEPDPIAAAVLALLGGADGITVHLREDRRHIQDRDVLLLRQVVSNRLNLEMAAADEIIAIACDVKPDEATLVPEKREELTTEGGLDVIANQTAVRAAIDKLHDKGIAVSLFIDPDALQVDMARVLGAQAVELQTAAYSEAKSATLRETELDKLRSATAFAVERGLHVHMGHGLNSINLGAIAGTEEEEELTTGHSIIARAVMVGMERAVREIKDAMAQA